MNFKKTLSLLLAMMMVFTIAFPVSMYADDEIYEDYEFVDDYVEDGDYLAEEPLYEELIEYDLEEPQQYPEEEELFFDEVISEDEPLDAEIDDSIKEDDVVETVEVENLELNNAETFEAGAPTITTAPESQTVADGATVTFTVVAENATAYQWQVNRDDGKGFVNLKDSSTWNGTTEASFSFRAAESRAAFSYRVVVSNGSGSVTSDPVTFTIEAEAAQPTITTAPESQTVADGATVTFTVAADNATAYQWQVNRDDGKGFVNLKDSSTWHGTTDTSFSFRAAESRAAFSYRVVVSNDAGSVESAPVTFTIGAAPTLPTITTAPESQTVADGATVTFTVVAENATAYQWQVDRNDGKGFVNLKDSSTWHGTKEASFSFKAAASRAAFSYRVVVSNDGGSVESAAVTFTIGAAPTLPTITTAPESQTVADGATVTFTVVAENATAYQWQVDRNDGKGFVNLKDSSTWHGTKEASFSFKAAASRAAFSYRVVVSNDGGSVESAAVTFTIGAAPTLPTITTAPASQTVADGATVTFTVAAENATAYQWQVDRNDGKGFVKLKDSSTWHGTTETSFSFKAASSRAAFSYRVVVSNDGGSVESAPVTFTIGAAPTLPTITTAPESQTVLDGATVTFTVAAENATAYQWQVDRNDGKGFVNLKDSSTWHGTKEASFSFKAAESRVAYSYRVVVSNDGGSVESAAVTFSISKNFIVNDVTYEAINDTQCRIVSYSGTSTNVVIPENFQNTDEWYKNLTIIEVGEGAFENNTTLTSIDLPDTIQVIGKRAFANCANLSKMS